MKKIKAMVIGIIIMLTISCLSIPNNLKAQGDEGKITFYSHEASNSNYRAKLDITYTNSGNTQSVSLQPQKDTYRDRLYPNTVFGYDSYLEIGFSGTNRNQDIFIYFDINVIPSGSTINSASLKLYAYLVSDSVEITVFEHGYTSWNEGITYNSHSPSSWSSPSISDTVTTSDQSSWIIFDVTAHVTDWYLFEVQQSPSGRANYGFYLRSGISSGNQAPTCSLTANPNSGIAPLSTTFSLTASDPDGTISSWTLITDDNLDVNGYGNPPSQYSYTYSDEGTYTPTLTVTDNNGATGSSTTTVYVNVNQPPTCILSAIDNSGDVPFTATFLMSANDPDGSIDSWTLDVDGNGIADYWDTGKPPAFLDHIYQIPGTFTATLTVKDNKGDFGTAFFSITAHEQENHPPVLSEGKVTPLFGVPDDIYTYEVTYKDLDGDTPSIAKVIITIHSIDQISVPMTLAESGEFFYETGVRFQCKVDLSKTLSEEQIREAAKSGTLGYYFYFEDGHDGYDYYPLSEILPGPDIWTKVQIFGIMAKAAAEYLVAAGAFAKVLPYLMLSFVPNVLSDFYYNLNRYTGNYYAVPIGCPVNITITDQFGRTINNNGINNIPNTYILKIDNLTIFFMPENLTSNIKINATDEGVCNILKATVGSKNNVSITGKFNIPITDLTKINLTLNFSTSNYVIYVDSDGDDITDVTYTSDFSTIEYCDYPIAFFNYTPQETVTYESVEFDASLSIYSSNLNVDYSWDFGDGTTGLGKVVSHTYDTTGNYTVVLNLTDEKEQSSIYQHEIYIKDIYPPITNVIIGEPKFEWFNDWVTSHTSFNLTANDDPGGLGINTTYYRIWYNQVWTPWMEYEDNFTLFGEGRHIVEFYSTDQAGNIETINSWTLYVDDSPPVTALSIWGSYYIDGSNEWITTATPLVINAWDLPSYKCGIGIAYYRISKWIENEWQVETDWTPYHIYPNWTEFFFMPSECLHQIEYYGLDHLGNTELIKTKILNVDNSPPVTTLTFSLPYYNDGIRDWITSSTLFVLTAIDHPDCASGIAKTYYCLDGGLWQEYVGPFIVVGEGEHVICYYSTDHIGFIEGVHEHTFCLDDTPPEILDVSDTPLEKLAGGYVNISCEIMDDSAVDQVRINITGPVGFMSCNTTMDSGLDYFFNRTYLIPGIYSYFIWANDDLDNRAVSDLHTFEIVNPDNMPPNTIKSVGEPKYGINDEWVTSNTEFNFTATDDLSGINAIYYRIWFDIIWTPWTKYTSNFTLSGEGKHYLEFYSVDNAGNVEVTHNQTHYVDDSPPVATISASPNSLWPPNHQMKNVVITGSATDTGSGIASVTFTVVDEYDLVEPTLTGFGQTIQLEAWRNGNDRDGRTYTITATATDNLGHVTTASSVVLVPHDQGN